MRKVEYYHCGQEQPGLEKKGLVLSPKHNLLRIQYYQTDTKHPNIRLNNTPTGGTTCLEYKKVEYTEDHYHMEQPDLHLKRLST